jgi:hypothetical protein
VSGPTGSAFTYKNCAELETAAKDAKNSLPHFENFADFFIFVAPLRKSTYVQTHRDMNKIEGKRKR